MLESWKCLTPTAANSNIAEFDRSLPGKSLTDELVVASLVRFVTNALKKCMEISFALGHDGGTKGRWKLLLAGSRLFKFRQEMTEI